VPRPQAAAKMAPEAPQGAVAENRIDHCAVLLERVRQKAAELGTEVADLRTAVPGGRIGPLSLALSFWCGWAWANLYCQDGAGTGFARQRRKEPVARRSWGLGTVYRTTFTKGSCNENGSLQLFNGGSANRFRCKLICYSGLRELPLQPDSGQLDPIRLRGDPQRPGPW
jgi:hypothetical protein